MSKHHHKSNAPAPATATRDNKLIINQSSLEFTTQMRTGILPPPNEMEKYENLLPGITNRLLATYEKQVDHRINLENKVIESDISRGKVGQIFAFVLNILTILSGFILKMSDKPSGIWIIICSMVIMALLFIVGLYSQKKELKNKSQSNPDNK